VRDTSLRTAERVRDAGDGRGAVEMGGRRHCRQQCCQVRRAGRAAARVSTRRSIWEFFHEVGGGVSIRCGTDGDGGVWAGISSASGRTERAVLDGPELNLAHGDPRGLTGFGPLSPPGWG
jgi:hypothetical protein